MPGYTMRGDMSGYGPPPEQAPPLSYAQQGGYGGDTNEAGAANDPFAYTQGSLLTPWQGRFSSSGYGGGYSAPEFTAFNYADFGYNAPSPGRFTENYADPAAFRFADFQGPSAFKAPTAEDMKKDPGYQARMDAGMKAATAAAAHGGAMRTGGFAKGMQDYAQNAASQEYGNTYNRASSEWDRKFGTAKDVYGINQGNTKQAFDTNTANRLAAHQARQNDWSGNANVALQEGQLGYNIAQGTYDRNYQKARQGYDDQQAHNAAVAAASNANASQGYERDLADYNRSRDEFWTNQDRQNALTTQERDFGYGATQDYLNRMDRGYAGLGDYAVGAGDARAAGDSAASNAWGGFFGDLGGMAGGAMMSYGSNMANQPKPQAPQGPHTYTGISGPLPGTSVGMPGARQPVLASRPGPGAGGYGMMPQQQSYYR